MLLFRFTCASFFFVWFCSHVTSYRYFGLSSSGITYKSGSASSGSSNFQNSDRYGGFNGTKDSETFKDSCTGSDRFGQEKFEKSTSTKSSRNTSKKESTRYGWFLNLKVASII